MANDDMSREEIYNILRGAGIANVGPLVELVDQAVREGWNEDQLVANLYASPTFHNMFPGIFRNDGSLKMDPVEYRTQTDSYLDLANRYGVSVTKEDIAHLFTGNVSVEEFQARAVAVERVETFKPAMKQFAQALEARGIDASKLKTDEGLADFVLGLSDKKFYSIWEETNVGTAARLAGIHLGTGAERRIANSSPGFVDEAQLQTQMKELAQNIKTVMPISQIQKMGISKKDLIQLEFGGPQQAEIAKRVEMVTKNDQRFWMDRSHTDNSKQSEVPPQSR